MNEDHAFVELEHFVWSNNCIECTGVMGVGFHHSLPFVPFWLKVGWWPIFLMANSCASGDCLVATPSGWVIPLRPWCHLPWGVWWPAVLLLLIYLVGVCNGFCLSRVCRWIGGLHWPTWCLTPSGVRARWCILVSRAVNFVRKRRLVSFAFSNYRNTAEEHRHLKPYKSQEEKASNHSF